MAALVARLSILLPRISDMLSSNKTAQLEIEGADTSGNAVTFMSCCIGTSLLVDLLVAY